MDTLNLGNKHGENFAINMLFIIVKPQKHCDILRN